MVRRYRSQVIVEAVQWTGSNYAEIAQFVPRVTFVQPEDVVEVFTSDGPESAVVGDFIIRDEDGYVNILDYDSFIRSYEEVT